MPDTMTIDSFDDLRQREFSRLDEQGIAYLDYAAAGLYSASQARAYSERLCAGIYGNPHSEHLPSRASERDLEAARRATLAFFDADPDVYDVCFTANTSAAIKLVAESYAFGPRRGLLLSADNHNSVNGMREYANRAGAPVGVLQLDSALRLEEPARHLRELAKPDRGGLFAFPVQSNFSGVRHPLELVVEAKRLGLDVLIDAAGCCLSGDISLRRYPADFLAFSYYKLFGLPTGVGALIARRDALERLNRPWFAGGTVDFVSIAHDRHQLTRGHAGFEDGTPNFLSAAAILDGFDFISRHSTESLRERLRSLTSLFISEAQALAHPDGSPLVRLYGPANMDRRGGTVAFNILRPNGETLPYWQVEHAARDAGIAIRGGCFCNPGAAERAFDFERHAIAGCLDALGAGFTIPKLQQALGNTATVGALRLSIGAPTIKDDIERAIVVLASMAAA